MDRKAAGARAPALVHRELELTAGLIRDLFTDDVDEVVIDDKDSFAEIQDYLKAVSPELRDRVKLYKGTPADLRRLRHRAADREDLRAQGVAQEGRLHLHRPHRGAGRHRREHRPLHRQEEPGRDDPPHQHRGGARDPAPAAAARHRRHHRHRLHRHGDRGQQARRARRAAHRACARTAPAPGVRGVGPGPGRDDAPARALQPARTTTPRTARTAAASARWPRPRPCSSGSSAPCGGWPRWAARSASP